MIQELFTFITQRWDFLLPLIYEHLHISAIAIVFATIVGVSAVSYTHLLKQHRSFTGLQGGQPIS